MTPTQTKKLKQQELDLTTLSESQLIKYFKTQLEKKFIKNKDYKYLNLTPGSGIPTGFPDVMVIFKFGIVFFIEFKKPKGGILSPAQKLTHTQLKNMEHRVYTLYTKNDVLKLIKEMEKL